LPFGTSPSPSVLQSFTFLCIKPAWINPGTCWPLVAQQQRKDEWDSVESLGCSHKLWQHRWHTYRTTCPYVSFFNPILCPRNTKLIRENTF
jgi:hypothetical protein